MAMGMEGGSEAMSLGFVLARKFLLVFLLPLPSSNNDKLISYLPPALAQEIVTASIKTMQKIWEP